MDDSAAMVMLQITAEEVDAREFNYEELRQATEKNLMGKEANDREKGNEEDGKAEQDGKVEEDLETEEVVEAEEEVEDWDWEQGGVALAQDY